MLIDESERTFKIGIIVTVTVTKVLDDKVLCKLDNGLDAVIFRDDLIGMGSQQHNRGQDRDKKLQDAIQANNVISGRIFKISSQEEKKFSVQLKCKKEDLENHENFIEPALKGMIPPEDLKNHNLQLEKRG